MAIYHFSLKTIGRADGRSAVASAAYISGTKLRSYETGLSYNYRKKKEVVFRHIFLPEHAPENFRTGRFFGMLYRKSRNALMPDWPG